LVAVNVAEAVLSDSEQPDAVPLTTEYVTAPLPAPPVVLNDGATLKAVPSNTNEDVVAETNNGDWGAR
jgi:hypothetical protein